MEFCRITAPFDARVGLRNVDPGNFVRASESTPILSIAQIEPVAVFFTSPQDLLPDIAKAMKGGKDLEVVAYGSDDKTVLDRGKLVTIDNAVDITTGTIKLKATMPNTERTLWPGQFVNARVLIGTDRNALTVPASAVQHGPDGLFVYKVETGDTVSVQPIKVSRQSDGLYIVTDGLSEGTQVVTGGQSRLQNGARFVVNQSVPAKSGS